MKSDITKSSLYDNITVKHIRGDNKKEVLEELSKVMLEKGFVKKNYIDAIYEREKVFPTGLPTDDIGVAIPHTDYFYVEDTAIGIGILEKPVEFNVMGDLESTVDVEILFMLAIKDPDGQLKVLQNLIDLFQDGHTLQYIKNNENEEEVSEIVRKSLSL